jgi:hypothetical protein
MECHIIFILNWRGGRKEAGYNFIACFQPVATRIPIKLDERNEDKSSINGAVYLYNQL